MYFFCNVSKLQSQKSGPNYAIPGGKSLLVSPHSQSNREHMSQWSTIIQKSKSADTEKEFWKKSTCKQINYRGDVHFNPILWLYKLVTKPGILKHFHSLLNKETKNEKKMDLEIMQQLKNLINCVLFYAASAIFHPTARGNIANMRADLTSNLD